MTTLLYKSIIKSLKIASKVMPIPKPLLLTAPDSSLQLVQLMADAGCKRVLIVTDKVLTSLNLYQHIVDAFEQQQVAVTVYDDIEPDPKANQVREGINKLNQHDCDYVLAIGGGSVIDAAKMIAALAKRNKDVSKCQGMLRILKQGLPLYTIPTTAGTGSEATMAAVITSDSGTEKFAAVDPVLVPKAAALDANLMTGLPAPTTAATGIDALTHAIEAYISVNASKETNDYALAACKSIFKYLPKVYQDGSDVAARQQMALASTYAGLAFNKAGVGYVHAIAHQLGALYHVPHGLANAIVLPHIVEYSSPNCQKQLAELATAIGCKGSNDVELALEFKLALQQLLTELSIPEKVEKLQQQDFATISKAALKEAHYLYAVPRYMNNHQCQQILHKLLP